MEEVKCPDGVGENFLVFFQKNIKEIEAIFKLEVALRGSKIMFSGPRPQVRKFRRYLDRLLELYSRNGRLGEDDFRLSLHLAETGRTDQIQDDTLQQNLIKLNGKEVLPKTYNQREYVKAIRDKDLVFGIGPAGTGKTFLAIAMALHFLISKRVERIVLTRPVVEAGEKLGFLPGDIQQKVNPYFRPLYDALYFLIGIDKTSELIESNIIEIAPLAYMRGRTILNSFIILDEGQNTLNSQMKMFLTRFGQNSRVVVTADITQIDLGEPRKSGIFKAIKILHGIEGIGIVYLTEKDIVRHPLVQKIILAYEGRPDEL